MTEKLPHDSRKEYSRRTAVKALALSLGFGFGFGFGVSLCNLKLEQPAMVEGNVFGLDKPLTQEELDLLRAEWNNSFEQGGVEMNDDTFYATFMVSESAAREHEENMGESIVAYYERHVEVFNTLLKQAPGLKMNTFKVRRLCIIQDGVIAVPSNEVFSDSDGMETISMSTDILKSAYVEDHPRKGKIDYGRLHEWAHLILHLPDLYSLDISPDTLDTDSRKLLDPMAANFREYISTYLLGGGIMDQTLPQLDPYSIALINRRYEAGQAHDKIAAMRDLYEGFPAEFPGSVNLSLGMLPGTQVKIYRSERGEAQSYHDKYREEKFIPVYEGFVDETGFLHIENVSALFEQMKSFDGHVVPFGKATLLIRAEQEGLPPMMRYMDIRSFNLAAWLSKNPESVEMSVHLVHPHRQNPNDFPWEVKTQ